MVVFVNSKGEIKDVGSTKQVDLVGVVLRDEENPFKDWSIAKICCYRIETFDGYVTMMTPYVDTRIIEHIDQLGKQVEAVTPYMDSQRAYIGDSSVRFNNVKGTHVTSYCETDSGLSIPTTTVRVNGTVTVSFNTLEEVATVTISSI